MALLPEDLTSLISDGDRDAAVERLQEAFSEGHLSSEEMDERLQTALTARTQGDLVPALAALPSGAADSTVEIEAVGGRIERGRGWRVPRTLRVESAFGKVELDLSRAVIEYPVVDIELRLGSGRARIVLPHDATVDYEGLRADWKQPVHRAPRRAATGGPHIRISGAMGYGRLKITHRRR
ncbi:DUF1707 domain-containing protein [Streptomyces sp. NPDC090052]|uniref:DUF1707 SHOCT-like domain-containing protein n=1 Tax=unclassified Streptomyces TaxID=2593676 RepID=UPI0022586D42|nr:DUF1707 domain-containing protein [Streptomyces sp. NBC_01306]MCX4728943.1 DUF1707 domain-containing protein [Streptomyces sp. NBC_01306]WSV08251.1 DUF1707 domain-containing protein [Streptomyces sp. NBC_01020]WSX46340.1 DUF1707 domain-containing protein [Streptomyces sp. NBC_00963]WSX65589.1 DUF1707 domain-containing protein [Streptomyces sp. NBC_00932]